MLKNKNKGKFELENLSSEWFLCKFFDAVLKFDLPTGPFLKFTENSAAGLIQPVLVIGDLFLQKDFHLLTTRG